MKRTIFVLFLWLIGTTISEAAIGVTTYPIPKGIFSVNPEQGSVDLAAEHNPLGVTEITIDFWAKPQINRNCTLPAQIFVDGGNIPADEVFASETSQVYADQIDEMMSYQGSDGEKYYRTTQRISIRFHKKFAAPGLYRVVIPMSFFESYKDDSTNIELGYEIYIPWEVTPVEGVYDSLSEFILEFPDYNEVEILQKGEFKMVTYPNTEYILLPEIVREEGEDPNKIRFTFRNIGASEPTVAETKGMYLFAFEEGAFRLTTYGPQYYENPADKYTEETGVISFNYWIRQTAKPTVDPPEGEIESARTFIITYQDDFTLISHEEKDNKIGLYRVHPDGRLSFDKTYPVICTAKTAHTATLNLAYWQDNGDEAGQWKPYRAAQKLDPGNYCLYIPYTYFMGNLEYNDKLNISTVANSDPVYLYYTVPTPIFDAEITPAENSVLDELSQIEMRFPLATNLDVNSYCVYPVTVSDSIGGAVNAEVTVTVPGTVSPHSEGDAGDETETTDDELAIKAILTFEPAIKTAGTYTVNIPTAQFVSGDLTSPGYALTYTVNGSKVSVDETNRADEENAPIYDLMGRRATDPAPGIYIRAGKKLIIR